MINLNTLKKYYYNSPEVIKRMYSSIPFSLRNGKEYRSWMFFLEKNDIDLEEYELLKIKETIDFAYNNITFYNTLYKKNDIHPQDINSIADYRKLPIIDKNTVKINYNNLQNNKLSRRDYFYVTTGGTSGVPTIFLQSNNVWKKELAFVYNLFEHYSYLPSMKKVSFRGGEFNKITNKKFWKQNPLYNECHFSPFHISEKTIHFYIKKLNEIEAPLIHSYPSSLINLVSFMTKQNIKLNYTPETIMLISEDIVENQVQLIRKTLNCKVTSFYGHSERLIFAPNLNGILDGYTVDRRYGYMELVNANGENIVTNGIDGEMIGTSFDNYMMPLIRYRTNDYTSYKNINKGEINLIRGRWEQEYLIGKGDTKISLAAINTHSDSFQNVLKFQYYQTKIGTVFINCVVNNKFAKEELTNIEAELNSKTKDIIEFKVKVVKEMELTSRGKFKQLINKISENDT